MSYQPMPVSGANADREVRRGIRTMRLAIAAQAVLYLVIAGLVWYLATTVDDLGDIGWPLVFVSVNAVLMVVLVVCAVRLGRRERKVVFTIMGLETAFAAMLLIGLIATFFQESSISSGAPAGLVAWGLLMLAVMRPVQQPEFRAAFGLPPMRTRPKKK